MKISQLVILSIICSLLFSISAKGEIFYVGSQQEFNNAHDSAAMNDSIVWMSGIYSNIYMDIEKDHLFITADTLGGTIFTGNSRVEVRGDYITLQGFQFVDGDINTENVIETWGSYNVFTQINIRAYTSYKYLVVREECQFTEITYCNFENRRNGDDKNILSILVDDVNPGYHKIQYCSFKNFDGIGNDQGIEPIRIGLSTQGEFISRTTVEYCYFTQCNGDGEIISSKARQNVYRFNTFEDNPLSELVLRHGSEGIVYGNFFLNGKGGIRVREGQDHYIYNNYFYGLSDRAIYLQNDDSDPLENINIAFNTIVDCSEVRLGGNGDYKPTNVTFANNLFYNPNNDLFDNPTETETWIGNIAFGDIDITLPESGMTVIDPQLEQNSGGFYGLSEGSPAINAAQPGYALLPQYGDIEGIDTDISFDLMGQNRSELIEEKDLGCNEYPHNILIQPFATEENTGPSYFTSDTTMMDTIIISSQNTIALDKGFDEDFVEISPNPASDQLNITIHNTSEVNLAVAILNLEGRRINTIFEGTVFLDKITLSENIEDLPAGLYTVLVIKQDLQGEKERIQTIKFVKL